MLLSNLRGSILIRRVVQMQRETQAKDNALGLEDQKKAFDNFAHLRQAAEQGNAMGQYILGGCYRYGEGVEKDCVEAVKWYRKAAEQGNATGQYILGTCYENGEGVKKDYAEAVKWYRKAAAQGDAYGQCSLGDCYYNGKGVDKDEAEAIRWYRKAADQGYWEAKLKLKSLHGA